MEYLLNYNGTWEIARAGAIEDDTKVCNRCDGYGGNHDHAGPCIRCKGTGRMKAEERTIRLAWFRRDGSIICFDYNEPEVRRLPE